MIKLLLNEALFYVLCHSSLLFSLWCVMLSHATLAYNVLCKYTKHADLFEPNLLCVCVCVCVWLFRM